MRLGGWIWGFLLTFYYHILKKECKFYFAASFAFFIYLGKESIAFGRNLSCGNFARSTRFKDLGIQKSGF